MSSPTPHTDPGDAEGLVLVPMQLQARAAQQRVHTSTTGLRSTPTPSIAHSTTSPALSERFGSMNSPQPHGVPVRITSPGSSVNDREQKLISSATPKIISEVFESCTTSPFTRVVSLRFWGF